MPVGGLPAGSIRPGSTGAQRQMPRPVPYSSSAVGIAKLTAYRSGKRPRPEPERHREEYPRGESERGLLQQGCRAIERKRDRDKDGERDRIRERAACAHSQHGYPILIDLILSPILMPSTTSMPPVTWPKFVYMASRKRQVPMHTNHW